MLIFTGMRRTECAPLRWTLVDKSYPQLLDLQPTEVDGADATDVNDCTKAYAQLQAMAAELRRRTPELSAAQAFARIFEDQANAILAARAQRHPQAGEAYAMPN